ncbi:hypothetical protein N7533_004067 [Penicillium manginii]|uniref:uncharacterized protein n=1 Tax=Penicillium manginii TaxID=203109 RepID=UPI002548DE89|nr:uncharacterized protein N7533_004067 [Penicillium manginii]KAJ5754524.1 hypothetical protein N7533_004067 [Penicillium manginii]
MKFLASIALLAATVSAGPVASRAPKQFTLKTSGAENDAHNDLYLYSYHTGAGLSDAVFSDGTANSAHISLNGTEAQVDLGNTFSWGIIASGDNSYSNWESVEINAGTSSKGFSIKNGNFIWTREDGFGGWLVCDWVHDAPQLFYLHKRFEGDLPSSCDKVDLKPEY